jgi:hypothetical protein
MLDAMSITQCLMQFDPTTIRRLALIVSALLSMTGRVTMLGMSRWSEDGCTINCTTYLITIPNLCNINI